MFAERGGLRAYAGHSGVSGRFVEMKEIAIEWFVLGEVRRLSRSGARASGVLAGLLVRRGLCSSLWQATSA